MIPPLPDQEPWDIPDPLSPDYVPDWARPMTTPEETPMPRTRTVAFTAYCGGCRQNIRPRYWDQDLYLCHTCADAVRRMIRRWATGRSRFDVDGKSVSLPLAQMIRQGFARVPARRRSAA